MNIDILCIYSTTA